jgi:predicted nucleic acid-binding protein
MIAVDTNVLVYAHRREAKEHAIASRKLSLNKSDWQYRKSRAHFVMRFSWSGAE